MPKAVHVLLGTYGRKTVELHDRYGPAVRVGPGELSLIGGAFPISSPVWRMSPGPNCWWIAQARLDIMARPQKDELVKDMRSLGENLMDGYGLITAPTGVHPRMRRIFSRAFSSSSVQKQAESIVANHVNMMMSKMAEVCQGGGTLDLGDMLNLLIYDVVTDVAFGESLKLLETGEQCALGAHHGRRAQIRHLQRRVPGSTRLGLVAGGPHDRSNEEEDERARSAVKGYSQKEAGTESGREY